MVLPDLWDDCYVAEHRKMPPGAFRKTFCGRCLNAGCRNSLASETKWVQRMQTQEGYLLKDPRFADPKDPEFTDIRNIDFPDMVRHALAVEVSTRKGDWSVPTEDEIGEAAAEMLGVIPSFFQAEERKDPEPKEVRVTAKELISQIKAVQDISQLEGLISSEETRRTVIRAFEAQLKKLTPPAPVEEAATPPEPVVESPQGEWRIRGDSGTLYDVVWKADGIWACSCAAYKYTQRPCKHVESVQARLNNAAKIEDPTPIEAEPPSRPAPSRPPPAGFQPPRSYNTGLPSEGIMVGGPDPAPVQDEWEAPQQKKERVIPVGGKVSFGSGEKK